MSATACSTIPTPAIVIDAAVVKRNLWRMAQYARSHGLNLRPHTKTHKSIQFARLQLEQGAAGLTVAKAGEAQVMSQARPDVDLLIAYPIVDARRCTLLAELARQGRTIRVGIDSTIAADALANAAQRAQTTLGMIVDLDVGLHRTGVQSPKGLGCPGATHRAAARLATRRNHVLSRPHLGKPRSSSPCVARR